MVERFPLEKANEAYGTLYQWYHGVRPKLIRGLDAMLKGTVRFRAVITFD